MISEILLGRFLDHIMTGDEKWVYFDNPKCNKSWVSSEQLINSTAKPNIHSKPRECAASPYKQHTKLQVSAKNSAKESEMAESNSDLKNCKNANFGLAADGKLVNYRCNWADFPEQVNQLSERQDVIFTTVGGLKKRPHDPDNANSGTKKGLRPGTENPSKQQQATIHAKA
ncbi:hypothetical protein LAZ67_X003001 [Cordylochernes scorpioides]|uniref:Uncharacterized protein n=1 Tax=Cordylochernes scorpioides TaxID=51811 RepID=A0ABY6LTT3_9ARAC|nr:hypothetical protein LAZ67_X003001 [Cordylochernes scorpioides]